MVVPVEEKAPVGSTGAFSFRLLPRSPTGGNADGAAAPRPPSGIAMYAANRSRSDESTIHSLASVTDERNSSGSPSDASRNDRA